MIDFTRINYLRNGNERQKRALEVLTKYKVLEKLKPYSPLLTGTVPIQIDIESSDLDVICEVDLRFEKEFLEDIVPLLPSGTDMKVENTVINGEKVSL